MPRKPKPWRRGGGPWYAQVRGDQIRLAPKEATEEDAWKALYRVLGSDRPPAKQKPTANAPTSTREILANYMAHCRGEANRGERSRTSLENKDWFIESADGAFGQVAAAQLKPLDVLKWLDAHPTWGITTRAIATRHVKAAFNWAKQVGHLEVNPLDRLKAGRTPRREDIPTEDQVKRILDTARGPLHDILFALVSTGCRPVELRQLTADRVDVVNGVWVVVNKVRGKTGEQHRPIYLTDALIELSKRLLARWPVGEIFRNRDGRPWTKIQLTKRLIQLRERLAKEDERIKAANPDYQPMDLDMACLYSLRHRFCTTGLVNGVPIATMATLLGHRDTTMVMSVYSKLNLETEHLRDAARQARGHAAAPPSHQGNETPQPPDGACENETGEGRTREVEGKSDRKAKG